MRQVMPFEYDLILKPDVNTQGHTQWYYFSVSNMIPGVPYKFNVINLLKPNSLYNAGMQPVVYSTKAAEVRTHTHTQERLAVTRACCLALCDRMTCHSVSAHVCLIA